ncbi:aldo/keto reductase [Halioxenophilus sp. WMMB6]|uniref:aldo/keto reductase family protein n=1 Tax=Halioxenophilus sp. WMMB6 TaxID=3073815 RepID=UPI00295E42E3|nr:aldo/keto reductase [Halioxenophilus sp. WMMB6]
MEHTHPSAAAMPKLIYGTAWKKEQTQTLVEQAFQAGFRGFDTACQPRHYAEPLVGKALLSLAAQGVKRADYYLQSKYTSVTGQDAETIPYDPSAAIGEQVAASFNVSLENLHTSYLDALVLHSPFANLADTMAAWRAMEKIAGEGGALRLGISNCYDLTLLKTLYDQAQIKPAIVQNRFYATTGFDGELRAWCQARGITYQSFWTLTANKELLDQPQLLWIARQRHQTPAQTLFSYLHQRGVVPLTGTSSGEHMREDLASFDQAYSAAELEQLDELLLLPA